MKKLAILAMCGGAAIFGQETAPAPLTPVQRESVQRILQSAGREAKLQAEAGAQRFGDLAKQIDRNLLSEKPDGELDRKLSGELTEAVAGVVRAAVEAKLNAARELVNVLTPAQKKRVLAEVDKPGTNPDLTELIGKVFAEPR